MKLYLKGLLMFFYIYIKIGILTFCTGPWHDTSCMGKAEHRWQRFEASWWIYDVYRYWFGVPLTPFNPTVDIPIILTDARRRDYTWRPYPFILQVTVKFKASHGTVHLEVTIVFFLSIKAFFKDKKWSKFYLRHWFKAGILTKEASISLKPTNPRWYVARVHGHSSCE